MHAAQVRQEEGQADRGRQEREARGLAWASAWAGAWAGVTEKTSVRGQARVVRARELRAEERLECVVEREVALRRADEDRELERECERFEVRARVHVDDVRFACSSR